MRVRNWIAVLALITAGMTPPSLADDCEFRADRNAGVDAGGVVKIVIHAGAGDLKVHGTDARRIDARGEACAGKQTLLDQAQVSVRREGNVVYVETQLPQDNDGWNWGKNEYAYIDLAVTLPVNIAVEATDSSGDASFEDLKSLSLQDSSGDLTLARIAGAVDVNDSSGDLDIHDVKADVVVENDSSGDIRITKVDGSVLIEQDSSGSIRVEDVRGSVTVNNDSSGDIYAGRVKGDFTVKNDSSGSIGHTAIGGKISVPRED